MKMSENWVVKWAKVAPLLEECGSISLKSNDEIASFVNSEITLPDKKIAKVIDAIIK